MLMTRARKLQPGEVELQMSKDLKQPVTGQDGVSYPPGERVIAPAGVGHQLVQRQLATFVDKKLAAKSAKVIQDRIDTGDKANHELEARGEKPQFNQSVTTDKETDEE